MHKFFALQVKVKNAMMDKNQDFVGINWLKRITDIKNWPLKQDFYPWELLASRSSTTNRLLNNFDKFQDSYIEDVDESTLSRILNQISVCFYSIFILFFNQNSLSSFSETLKLNLICF